MNYQGTNGPPQRDHHLGWEPGNHHRPPAHHGEHRHQNQSHQPHHGHHQDVLKNPNAPPAKWHSYKMLVDPEIHRGAPKMMRYDGAIVPGNPHHVPPSVLDPRNKLPGALWKRMEAMDLPVPRFKIDENYVGEPPKVEVTVENMNDNIDKQFLMRMIEKCGVIEDVKIYYHPITGKHLGLAHLCFEEVKSAKDCVKLLHGRTVMGQQLNCYIDPLAKSCLKMYTDLTEEKKPEPEPEPEPEEEPHLPIPVETLTGLPPPPLGHPMQEPYGRKEQYSPGDKHDWAHHHYPAPRRESREDPRDHHPHPRDPRDHRDPRRLSHDHDRRQSRDLRESSHEHVQSIDDRVSNMQIDNNSANNMPFQTDIDDKGYQQTVFDPNYWQQEAQKYAAAVATGNVQTHKPAVPPPPIISSMTETPAAQPEDEEDNTETKDENDEDDSDHKVDLDTRLKMLMKGKANMPSFLLNELNGSEEDEDEEEEDGEVTNALNNLDLHSQQQQNQAPSVFKPELPLSRAPSPFLSEEIYKSCHESWQAQKLEASKQKNSLNNVKKAKSDDSMSLSSLSSGENNILQQGPLPNYYGYGYPPPPGFDPLAQQQSWYTQHYMGHHPHTQSWGDYNGMIPHQQHQHYPHYNDQTPWQDPMEAINDGLKSGKKNVFRPIIKEAVQAVVQDLTQTLTKDIRKRMCETLGFHLFEKWWQEQEIKYKEKHSNVPSTSKSSTTSNKKLAPVMPAAAVLETTPKDENAAPKSSLPRIPRVEDISSFFDKQRESMETTGSFRSGFGLGFRGTIPKLPAFKKKPVPESSKTKKKEYSSDEKESKKKSEKSEKRKEQEKRREERLKSKTEIKTEDTKNDATAPEATSEPVSDDKAVVSTADVKPSSSSTGSPKKKTIDSIYKSLYSDESDDESKDTDVSDSIDLKKGDSKSSSSDKEKRKNRTKKKPKDLAKKPSKRRPKSSVSSVVDSSSSSSESLLESSIEEEEVKVKSPTRSSTKSTKKTSKENNKKAVKSEKSEKLDLENESSQEEEESSVKKGSSASSAQSGSGSVSGSGSGSGSGGSSNSSSSSSNSSSEAELEPGEAEDLLAETETPKKKPAPIRRASETLKTDANKIKELEEDSASNLTPSHMAEDHCYARPEIKDEPTTADNNFESQFNNDHGYTRPRTPPAQKAASSIDKENKAKPAAKPSIKPAAIFSKKNKNTTGNEQLSRSVLAPVAPKRTFKERQRREEADIMFKFLTKGLDIEDIKYLKASYKMMLERQDDKYSKMLNYTHWVDHTVTDIPDPPPPKKKRKTDIDYAKPHHTGSARTEGYYKMDPREKLRTKYHLQRGNTDDNGIVNTEGAVTKPKQQTALSMSREMRSMQRRQAAVLGDEASGSDLLKFNQLKFRRKNMTFGKSSIHDWGLFAREYIGADEMVIEYVGQVVRPVISDVREKRYEKQGIGSSYLFRIDQDYVVDATKVGNLARFINHSCDPNCYAKIITIDGQKKITIYSKQPIAYGEEITYDYKFPIEDEKILCLCGSKSCRKYLN